MKAAWVKIRCHGDGWMFICDHCGDETFQPPAGNLDQAMDAMAEYIADHVNCPSAGDLLQQRIDGEPVPAWYTEDQ